MSGRVTRAALLRHHLGFASGGGFVVALLVLVLTILATAAPVALGRLGDATVQYRLAGLSAVERDVVADENGIPPVAPDVLFSNPTVVADVWGGFTTEVERIRTEAAAPLPDILQPARTIAVGSAAALADEPGTAEIAVAADPRYEDEIEIVDGRLPDPAVFVEPGAEGADGQARGRIEIVLSADTADELEWERDTTRQIIGFDGVVDVVLVGVFAPVDAAGAYWQHVPSVLEPNIFDDGNRPRVVTGTGFAHPASLRATFPTQGASVTTTVWYPFDETAVDARDAEAVAAGLRLLTAVGHTVAETSTGTGGILSLRFTADAIGAIDAAQAQERATAGVVAMIASGPIGVATAVLILGCRLVFDRRRPALRLLAARGADTRQLRALLALDGVACGILPALLGVGIGVAVTQLALGTVPDLAGVGLAVAVGVVPAAVLAILAPSAADRRPRADLGGRGSRLRVVLEGAVLVLAALALILLLLRGAGDGADLLTAATPLLLALVACVVTLRLYPVPLAALLRRSRGARDLAGYLGAVRALREPAIGLTPVLALVVGVSVAVSSGILLSTVQAGIDRSAGAQIGADVRVAGGIITGDQLAQLGSLNGVAGATGISGADPVTLDIDGERVGTSAFVVDADDLRAVQGEGPGMLPPGVSLAPASGPLPIVVSTALADEIDGRGGLRVGSVPAEVVGVLDGPAPIGARAAWLALDSSAAEETLGRDPSDRTAVIRLEEGADPVAVVDAVRQVVSPTLRIDTAREITDQIEESPAVAGLRAALFAATALAALLGALAVVMTLTLAAAPRARLLALLRTLGAPARIGRALAAWEVAPAGLAALVAGTLFGALVPLVVLAGVDLRSFTGSTAQPAYSVDPVILGVTLGAFVALVTVATLIALAVSRRARTSRLLRTVEEG
ncbi:ABC transporter permease [Microbacterium sp. ET2]|uniref:FtsX-like permease family protein n=1 Tax=Microbacterium albipurpureum TaxID=3050384 RepID=UPI00259C7180|nr:FtsX-like permease family protein [Microbacterium sp. ET2 (Ac-2212)]WJL94509.1 ABC transporter permease [Microbacterium sp. ET2 (Ac-2212)]